MRYEKKIGRKVWLLDGSLEKGFTLKDKREFTLVDVKMGKDCNDWANHFVIRDDENGNTIEVKEFQVIFALEGDNIERYLSDNEIYAADVSRDNDDNILTVGIYWGDWKHEHLWCRDLMEYIGYEEFDEKVTEEDGSDNYSAVHYFAKVA